MARRTTIYDSRAKPWSHGNRRADYGGASFAACIALAKGQGCKITKWNIQGDRYYITSREDGEGPPHFLVYRGLKRLWLALNISDKYPLDRTMPTVFSWGRHEATRKYGMHNVTDEQMRAMQIQIAAFDRLKSMTKRIIGDCAAIKAILEHAQAPHGHATTVEEARSKLDALIVHSNRVLHEVTAGSTP